MTYLTCHECESSSFMVAYYPRMKLIIECKICGEQYTVIDGDDILP